ncbi:MAG: RagB/SusD family nutrient uptake outer membrane protein [Bacteroidales bacterium]|nr:RagB/SusD family nutrient uptake outer membrane protein [Bacteroidales bacterium]
MKKHNYRIFKIISGILLISTIFYSCEDFLDKVPGDKITPDQHYKTSIDAYISMFGAYSILQEVVPNLVIMNDLRSDLMVETENFDFDLKNINRNNINVDNRYNDPSGYYRIIFNANEVLNNLEKIRKYDRDFDSLSLVLSRLDMISLRSWAYFTLVRLYGEAAYIPQDMHSYDENYQFEYYTKDRMIDTLISQLDTTFTYPDLFVDNMNYSTLIYERALRGELYLEKGDYKNAALCLINAIGDADIRARFRLRDYKEENWKNIFVNSEGQIGEVMSVVPFSYEDNQENPLADIFYADRRYLVKPSDYIVNLFSTQTSQEDTIGDIYRGKGLSYDNIGDKLVVYKYSLNLTESSGADIILYRAADILLLLAEALNQMGEYEAALGIVNDGYYDDRLEYPPGWRGVKGVRDRVLLTLKDMPTSNVKESIEDIIMEERAMELAFEGKRWFDLVRVANRRGESYLAGKVSAKYDDPNVASEVYNRLMDKNNWYLPFRK